MLIRQLSVFLENRNGMFARIARILGDNGVNMNSFNVSETQDFGLVRIIAPSQEVDRASALLKANSYAVSINQVVYLECANVPGAMADIMEKLAHENISIEYMYAYSDPESGKSHIVIRPDNVERANSILKEL